MDEIDPTVENYSSSTEPLHHKFPNSTQIHKNQPIETLKQRFRTTNSPCSVREFVEENAIEVEEVTANAIEESNQANRNRLKSVNFDDGEQRGKIYI